MKDFAFFDDKIYLFEDFSGFFVLSCAQKPLTLIVMKKFLLVFKFFDGRPIGLRSSDYLSVSSHFFETSEELFTELASVNYESVRKMANECIKEHSGVSLADLWFCSEIYILDVKPVSRAPYYSLFYISYMKVKL